MTRPLKAISFFAVLLLLGGAFSVMDGNSAESGVLSVYFEEQKIGYEEYTWRSRDDGFILEIKGRIEKPVTAVFEQVVIRLDPSFIPVEYMMKGTISGIPQSIHCSISQGEVKNTLLIQGKEQRSTVNIKRDAILLPNALYSPYMVITKKFGCSLADPQEMTAYIIPQTELSFTLSPEDNQPCRLRMDIGALQLEMQSDERGILKELTIPSLAIKVVRE